MEKSPSVNQIIFFPYCPALVEDGSLRKCIHFWRVLLLNYLRWPLKKAGLRATRLFCSDLLFSLKHERDSGVVRVQPTLPVWPHSIWSDWPNQFRGDTAGHSPSLSLLLSVGVWPQVLCSVTQDTQSTAWKSKEGVEGNALHNTLRIYLENYFHSSEGRSILCNTVFLLHCHWRWIMYFVRVHTTGNCEDFPLNRKTHMYNM